MGARHAAPIDRSADRLVALSAIACSLLFLAAALGSLALPAETRRGLWLPIHLALAGGATTAIAGVMPFFVAAFAAAPPADARLRAGSVGAIVLGATAVSIGVVAGPGGLAVGGGIALIGGVVLTGIASLRPLGRALGPSRGLVTQAYLIALAAVTIGATLATLNLAAWEPVVSAWGRLRPAHAWLNLFGFVSLVVATTLLHFFPTVVGARIANHPTARATVIGIGGGALLVPLGYVLEGDTLAGDAIARAGAAATIAGALALVAYAARIWATRGRWTTDAAWHRFAIGGLVSAMAWFVVGVSIAGGRVLVAGASPSGWAIDPLAAPLVAGWVGLAVLASATHLVPAVGPGDPDTHARQRATLGRAASLRLAILDAGVAALTLGGVLGQAPVTVAGATLVGAGLAGTLGLLGQAVASGFRWRAGGAGRA